MIDSHFLAFVGVAALLVLSPGATMVVVTDAAVDAGRRAALWTVAGVGIANGSLALSSALGLAALFHRFPEVLHVIAVGGAVYLAWLAVRALARAWRGAGEICSEPISQRHDSKLHIRNSAVSRFGRGLLTNYGNPSVVLFYTVVVPQFITSHDSFLPRYLLLGFTHVAMSVVWLTAFSISVGTLAEHMTRPPVRRTMDLLTGCALMYFAVKLVAA